MSMTRNGTKITNPMMNAARNSEIMNAGISVSIGTDAGVSGFSAPEARVIRARSSSRVFASMKSRSGPDAVSMAVLNVMFPAR